MKAIWVGVAFWLAATAGFAQRPAGIPDSSVAELHREYGNWRVLVTQNRLAGPKACRIFSSDFGIAVSVLSSAEKPLSLRGATPVGPGNSIRVRVDGHRALDLATAKASREVLRQMLAGRRVALEYDAWPSGKRIRAEASLEGFVEAWNAASVIVRQPDSVQAYLYEGCNDDYDCQVLTFCETGQPYCSVVTQSCQCTEPPPHNGGGCNQTFTCGQCQVWNASGCSCDCQASGSCPEGQMWDPVSCQCACLPDYGCGLPRVWNGWTCSCTCPDPTPQCPPGWNLDGNCECSWL